MVEAHVPVAVAPAFLTSFHCGEKFIDELLWVVLAWVLASALPTPALAAANDEVDSEGTDGGMTDATESAVLAVPGTFKFVPQIGHFTVEPANSGAMLTC